MQGVVRWLYLMALIVWLGELVFFSFVVAPKLFGAFPVEEAGRAVGAIFPIYYRVGYGCGVVLLGGSLLFLRSVDLRTWWGVNAAVVAVMLAATLYAGLRILPRATALRPQIHAADAPQSVKDEFSRLHRLSVQLNGVVLLGGIAVSVITAAALRP